MPRYHLPVVLAAALLVAVAVAVALRGQIVPESPGRVPEHPLQALQPPLAGGTPARPPSAAGATPAPLPAPPPAAPPVPILTAGIQPDVLARYRREAEAGNAGSQDNLGSCYEQGLGLPANPLQAVVWYRASAEQGFAPAQFHLGDCYENGKGVARDLEQARHWYRLAAGHGMAQAAAALKRIGDGHG